MKAAPTAGTSALLLALVLTGCTGPDPAPVPRTAAAPWLCSGVPRESIELALGDVELDDESGQGALGWRDEQFACTALAGDSSVLVRQQTVLNSPFGSTEPEIIATLEETSDGRQIEAEAPGRGYLTRVDEPVAVWVCTGFVTRVSISGEPRRGRDWSEDAVNLLVSMLPWACGEEEPPPTG